MSQQVQEIDYNETFLTVVTLKSVRIMLALAAYFGWEVWQIDIKTSFLHENLTNDVYMIQPEDFVSLANANKVCKLHKSIYALKHASRSWNIHFDEVIKSFGYVKSEHDSRA